MQNKMVRPSFNIVTFGTRKYRKSLSIQREAVRKLSSARHWIYSERDAAIQLAKNENPDLFQNKRGFGYWIWKPYIILDALNQISDGDYVVYLDAGIAPIANTQAWFDVIANHEMAVFAPVPPEPASKWTKRDCFVRLGCDTEAFYNIPMLSSGMQAYRKTPASIEFLHTLRETMQISGVLDDTENTSGKENLEGFVAHRHDQSVLCLLAHREKIPTLLEPTQYGIWRPEELIEYSRTPRCEQRLMNATVPHTLDVHRLRRREGIKFYIWRWKRRRNMKKLGLPSI
jgi:hypothetical protein